MGTSHPLSLGSNNHAFTANPNSTGAPYADIAARDADTAFHSVATNVDKVVKVTDADGSGTVGYFILVATTPTWESLGASLTDTFLELGDTPASYSGEALKGIRVNAGETALEFIAGGAVSGPGSSTDNAVTRFDGVTGTLLQNSLAILDDVGALSGLTQLDVDNLRLNGNTLSSTDTNGDLVLDPNGTGAIDASTSKIANVVDPTVDQDAATKAYVDLVPDGDVVGPASSTDHAIARFDLATGKLLQDSVGILTDAGILSGLTQLNVDNLRLDGNTLSTIDTNGDLLLSPNGTGAVDVATSRVINLTDPTAPQDATTKNYVDNLAQGVDWKNAVAAATTGDITLSGTQTIDGISVINDDRVLVKEQTLPEENGIYIVGTPWARSSDADTAAEVNNMAVAVSDGTVNGDKAFFQVDTVVTLDTDPLSFILFSSLGIAILKDGSVTYTGSQPFGGFGITGLADPSLAQDAATKAYVDLVPDGDVVGPASATDNALARFDLTTGKLIQNSVGVLTDLGALSGIASVNLDLGGDFQINATSVLNATTLGSAVVNSSLTTLGTIATGVWEGTEVTEAFGGTAQTIYAAGDILYAFASDNLEKLSIGSTDQVLSVAGGFPAYRTAPSIFGDVVGPASATDNALARFDLTTGKIVQNSLAILDDVGVLSGLTQLNVDNLRLDGNTLSSQDTNGNVTLDPNGTGIVDASTSLISNVVDPVAVQDAATRGFVDLEQVSNTLVVRALSDLPAPSAGAIDVSAYDLLLIRAETLDLGVNKITSSNPLDVRGLGALVTTITSSHADATFDATATLALFQATITNTGSNTRSVRINGAFAFFFTQLINIVDDIEIGLTSGIDYQGQFQGQITYVTANAFSTVRFNDVGFTPSGAFNVHVIEDGVTFKAFTITNTSYFTATDDFLIELTDPATIGLGTLDSVAIISAGRLTKCTPVSSSNFEGDGTVIRAVTIDGDGNLITGEFNTDYTKYEGLTSVVDEVIATVSTNDQAFAWHKGDLYSAQSVTGLITQLAGFSITVVDTVATGIGNILGMCFVGDDMLVVDLSGDVTIYEGFSTTIKETFTVVTAGGVTGAAFDGFNLMVCDDTGTESLIYVFEGVSNVLQYSFAAPRTRHTRHGS